MLKCSTRLASFLGFGVGNKALWGLVFAWGFVTFFGSVLLGEVDVDGGGVTVPVAVDVGVVHDDARLGLGLVALPAVSSWGHFFLGLGFLRGVILSAWVFLHWGWQYFCRVGFLLSLGISSVSFFLSQLLRFMHIGVWLQDYSFMVSSEYISKLH